MARNWTTNSSTGASRSLLSHVISLFLGFTDGSPTSTMRNKGPTAITTFTLLHLLCAAIFLSHLHRFNESTLYLVSTGLTLLFASTGLYWRLIHSDPGYLDPRALSSKTDGASVNPLLGPPVDDGQMKDEKKDEEEDVSRLVEEGCRIMKDAPRHVCRHCSSGNGSFVQPLRSRHCRDCGRCVRKFDHHCFWIGNCVGEGNHHLFVSFLVVESLVLFFGATQFPQGFISRDSVSEWILLNGFVALGFLISLVFFMLVIGLVGYHFFLIVTNQTSWEHLGSRVTHLKDVPDGVLPFSRGPLVNCFRFWCTRRPPYLREAMLLPPTDENGDYETTCWADCC